MSVLKVHYFLWFGSLSGIMPFVPIFAREHAVADAESVGILYCILPFVVSFIKPMFCSIADRNNAHKSVLITSIVLTILGYGLLLTTVFVNFGSFSWYWFSILVLIANSGQGIVISLTDYLVMKECTETNKSFGGYRVFGTIGWGGFGLLAGLINNYITQLPYLLPGLLLFIAIELTDLFCIYYKFKDFNDASHMITNRDSQSNTSLITKAFRATSQALSQLFRIFRNNPSLLQYVIIVTIFGCLTAFHWSFYFWFIEDIRGDDPFLMGLCLFVQSFIGELPLFMVSNRILSFFGPSMSLNISLLAFAIRYLCYGYALKKGNAFWDVLLIESVQGLTFSLFYTVMTDLAQYYANKESQSRSLITNDTNETQMESSQSENSQIKGNEVFIDDSPKHNAYATMQGIMGACFEGVGLGIGSLIGGFLIENHGAFFIWRVGAFIAFATILFNIVVELIKNKCQKQSINRSSNVIMI